MTEEELLNSFLDSPSAVADNPKAKSDTVTDKEDALLAQFLGGGEVVEPPPKVVEEVAPPGLLSRSLDALSGGASDAASSLVGDRDPAGNVQKAIFGDLAGAAGGIISDAAITAGKEVLPESWQENIGDAYEYVMESAPAQMISGGLERWREASPETFDRAGEIVNIAAMTRPTVPKVKAGRAWDLDAGPQPNVNSALPQSTKAPSRFNADASVNRNKAINERNRKKSVQALIVPDDLDVGDLSLEGISRTGTLTPNKTFQKQIDITSDVPGVSGKKTHIENLSAVTKEVRRVDADLKLRLSDAPDIDTDLVQTRLFDAMDEISDVPALKGAPAGFAESIQIELNRLLKEIDTGTYRPEDILDVRRKLDNWVEEFSPGVFEEGNSALKIANTRIRNTLNDIVADTAPDASFRTDMSTLSNLLTSRDTLLPRAKAEVGTTGLSRYIAKVERETGMTHPKTAASIRANIDPQAGLLAGSAALVNSLKASAATTGRAISSRGDQALIKALPQAGRVAALGVLNEDEKEYPYIMRR